MSVTSETATRGVRRLESLLAVAEELLFSFALPPDVVKKYEFMREQAMQKAGLYNSPSRIWELQREAHAKQRQAPVKEVKAAAEERRPEAEPASAKYELIARLDSANELIRHYQRVLRSISTAFDELQDLTDNEQPVRRQISQLADLVRQSQDQPLRVSELESSNSKLVAKYKELENEAQLFFGRYIEELGLKSNSLQASVNRLQTAARRQRDRIRVLEASEDVKQEAEQVESEQLNKLRVRLQVEKTNYEERLKRMRDEHAASREAWMAETKQASHKEIENLIKEKELAVREAKRLEIELEQQRAHWEREITELQSAYKREVELLSVSLQEENDLRSRDQASQLEELRRSHRTRENELLLQLERLTSEENSAVKEVREKLAAAEAREEDLHEVIRAIGERVHSVFVKHSANHRDWNADISQRKQDLLGRFRQVNWCVDQILEAEFACYLVAKLTADNDWLVERLAEFGKENEMLRHRSAGSPQRQEGLHKQVLEDIRTTSLAMKDFESARDRLVQQFRATGATRHSESPEIVSNLYKKYMGTPHK